MVLRFLANWICWRSFASASSFQNGWPTTVVGTTYTPGAGNVW